MTADAATPDPRIEAAYLAGYEVMRYHAGVWFDSLRAAVPKMLAAADDAAAPVGGVLPSNPACTHCGHFHNPGQLCLSVNRHLDCDCPGGPVLPSNDNSPTECEQLGQFMGEDG